MSAFDAFSIMKSGRWISKQSFLSGFHEERLYVIQSEGFVDPKCANKVCKLKQSIYGLVEASRSWNIRFDEVIKAYGFIQTFWEACIYKKVSGSSIEFLILYVDDILLIGNDVEFLNSIKGYLNKSFSMKDLSEAAYILGIKIYRDRQRHLIGLSQSTYLDKFWRSSKWISQRKGSCLCYKAWSWVRLNARPLQKIERIWKMFPMNQP